MRKVKIQYPQKRNHSRKTAQRRSIMTEQNFSEFRSIRQVAAAGVLSEHHLRLLLAQGKLPGIYSGNRFKINMRLLAEQLDRESAEAAQKGAC